MFTKVLVVSNANTHNSLGIKRMNQIAIDSLKMAKGNPEKDDVVFHFVHIDREIRLPKQSEEPNKEQSDSDLEIFNMRMDELFRRGTNEKKIGKQTANKVAKAARLFKITRGITNEEAFELACDTFDVNDRASYTHIVLIANAYSREDEKRFICERLLQQPMEKIFGEGDDRDVVIKWINPYSKENMKSENRRDEETPTECDL